jgi:sugar lactone lactonase YvrE
MFLLVCLRRIISCINVFTGTPGNSTSQLYYPYGIAHDWSSSILYIADQYNNRIMKYLFNASSGSVVAGGNGQGTSTTQLYLPVSVYFDSSSNSLFIANFGANNVVRWVLGASSWTLVAGSASGLAGSSSILLNKPEDIALDSMSNVYVADSNNNRVQFFFAGQSNGTTIAGVTGTSGNTATLFNRTVSVAVDAQFNLYVADCYNQRVQKFLHY